MAAQGLSGEVGDAASLLGLVLVLLTLFTSEQARRLDVELAKPQLENRPRIEIQTISTVLALFTAAALVGLSRLAGRSIAALHLSNIDPVLWIFVLTWFLLGGLVVWQASIVAKCAHTEERRRSRWRTLGVPVAVAAVIGEIAVAVWALVAHPT
jgi:hypothetical protein